MNVALFNERMKLADLILANPNLILMLQRFNISFGFGNKSVADVCAHRSIPADFFILICNVYSFNDYIPDIKAIKATDMSMLPDYLIASHKFYIEKRLPHIGRHLEKIANGVDHKTAVVLRHFFKDYFDEVASHFNYEENTVFPYINNLFQHKATNGYHIGAFTAAHSNIEDKLDDLTQIVFRYLPENIIPDEAVGVIFDILQLSDDIRKHSLIEEKILVPYVEYLEKEGR